MAWTQTTKFKTVFGDKRQECYELTADSASAEIPTGLSNVQFVDVQLKSAATGGGKVKENQGTSATAIAGTIAFTGWASGDNIIIKAEGY